MATNEAGTADIKRGERGEIEFTAGDGTTHTYYPSNVIWLDVLELEIITGLADPKDDQEPLIYTRLRGKARLHDDSIAVIGDPATKVRELSITLEAGDWKPKVEQPDEEGTLSLLSLRSHKGTAMLSFNRADWEIGTDDEWWSACYLPRTFIDSLAAGLLSGELQSLSLSMSLRGLYTTEHPLAPVSSRGDLYLKPVDGRITDMAQGYLWNIAFTSAPRNFRKTQPVEFNYALDDERHAEPSVQPADQVANAIAGLSARVDGLRTTLKWVGGLIVVALLFLSGR